MQKMIKNIAIVSEDPLSAKVQALAKRLNLEINPSHLNDYEFLFKFIQDQLCLISTKEKQLKPIKVDFSRLPYQRKEAAQSLLAKAVGIKKGVTLSVLDTTAGFGYDAFVLASLGCKLQLLERSPIMFALLNDALEAVEGKAFFKNMRLMQADAILYLSSLEQTFDVIYLDPMYPLRHKCADPKKEMRILRALIHDDADASILFEKALQSCKRVVVKRRRLDAPLGEKKPTHIYTGKSVRFDIYVEGNKVHG